MSQRGRIRRKDNGNSTFSMPSSKVTVKDMRIGQFDYELEEVLPTPIFHVQKDGIWSTNFLFSCLQEHLSDMVLVENEIDFMQSVYKLCLLETLGKPTNRFLHLSPVTTKTGAPLPRSLYNQLDYLMNKTGIDKLALMSYTGHLGYSYGETDTLKDPYVELRAKMISFREMAESFRVDLLQSDPCLYAHEEIVHMNKYFFRNRIKVCNKPSQKAYFETLIEQWGSKDLVESLKKDNGDFDEELLAKALWDTKSYSELKPLGAIFAHKIEATKILDGKMDDAGLLGAVKTLATDTAIHFKRHPFELKSVGMLISGSVVGRKKPEKILKSLEEMLYGCSDTTGIVVKSLLVGQKEFCRRVEELRKLLLQS